MKVVVEIPPTQEGIRLVDEMMKSYIDIHELPYERELCFVLHELVINAVEAMEKVAAGDRDCIQVKIEKTNVTINMYVIDFADGIPEEQWQEVLTYEMDAMGDNFDRGRGLFFVQHMVDKIWFEYVAPKQFLVGVTKSL
ncbi:MAG: sensor histidine kinase [Caryophanon sp.]|nr:sensor histidine kinase [Caryophanon sp.]